MKLLIVIVTVTGLLLYSLGAAIVAIRQNSE